MKALLILVASLAFLCGAAPAREEADAKRDRGILIWRDPGSVETLDLKTGPGGQEMEPRPPFTFQEELLSGSTPKIKVKDAAGRSWAVKWGEEAHAGVLASRLAWAAGYFTIPVYFVPEGEIQGARGLQRAGSHIDGGRFTNAAFQLWEDGLIRTNGWEWRDNPFVARVPGARELNGLKIVMMLTSNWDNKDAKEFTRGSNTTVVKANGQNGETHYQYMISDWGGAMGKWGGWLERSKWDCAGYSQQSRAFVRGIKNGKVEWGYRPSQYAGDMVDGIRVEDAQWLMQYLGRLTDQQLMDAASAAGATPDQARCYAQAIRERLEQLRALAS